MSTDDGQQHDLNAVAAYAEGRLTGDERARVVAHLSVCEMCRTTLAALLREPRITGEAKNASSALSWLPLAATLLLAAGGGYLAYRLQQPHSVAPGNAAPTPAPTPPDQTPIAPAGATPAPAPVAPPTPPPAAQPDPRRGSEDRRIGDKTFRLVAGEWIDTTFDRFALLETVTVRSREEQRQLLQRIPELQPYLALGNRFTVVHNGAVYRFELPATPR